MPKKTAHTRSTAQRNKPKAQKSVELVRPTSTPTSIATSTSTSTEKVMGREVEVDNSPEPVNSGVATPEVAAPTPVSVRENESTKAAATHNASAAERFAARRQAGQKAQRSSATLITAENYSYVRKDLIFIAILAFIMFAVIIGLHFVPAIGG